MQKLSYNEFQNAQEDFTESVMKSDHLAKFCSLGAWQSSAFENLHGFEFGVPEPGDPFIVEDSGNWLVFAERNENVFFPFEAAWMFGCPLVGDSVGTIELLEKACLDYLGSGFGFVVSGVLKDSDFHRELLRLAERSRRYEEFPTTDCLTIDLSDGIDGFLKRRSKSFRKSIRQMKQLDQLTFEDASELEPDRVFERIFDVQSRTYKAKEGGDIFSDQRYEKFYRDLYSRLFQTQSVRTIFAKVDETDVAYIMGGVCKEVYRGFQMSYDDDYRKYALGNRLQLENMTQRAAEGVTHYDLGMHSPYKERWADDWESYTGIFVVV